MITTSPIYFLLFYAAPGPGCWVQVYSYLTQPITHLKTYAVIYLHFLKNDGNQLSRIIYWSFALFQNSWIHLVIQSSLLSLKVNNLQWFTNVHLSFSFVSFLFLYFSFILQTIKDLFLNYPNKSIGIYPKFQSNFRFVCFISMKISWKIPC